MIYLTGKERKIVKRITEITKRDILDLFRNGLEIEDYFENKIVKYYYFGRLEEIDFLQRLYDLKTIPSNDTRFEDAEGDIWQHTVNNDDYSSCWVFEDERFELVDGSDEIYLRFICEVFHPAVRFEKGYWKEFLLDINELLKNDGYEIYPADKMSNRDVYGWRMIEQNKSTLFIPYSQRNAREIKSKEIKLSINRKARNQIYQLLEGHNDMYQATDETGYNYTTTIANDMFNDIKKFYIPKCYNKQNEYVDTDSLKEFILFNSPFYVLDAIEIFARYVVSNDFEAEVNAILRLNEILLQINEGKILNTVNAQININSINKVQEVGLKELLQDATKYYDEGNIQIAVEKIWDAFERLKTYYSPKLDKKNSVKKIIDDMSRGDAPLKSVFENEFKALTSLGNDFRIRHHEVTKFEIQDKRYNEYFYMRCLSLLSVATKFLDQKLIA